MNSMQRQFGKLTHKGAGDDAKVSVLLQDFDEADKMLTKIIDASKAWRDAWTSIITAQLGIVTSIEELYNPIVGASSDGHGHEPVMTSQAQLDRSYKLQQAYTELKTDLLEEVNMMDARIIRPASDAKEYIQPIKKTIKKRENKRLDYERHFDRVTSAAKKQKRDDAALAKAEVELSKATDEFKVADGHLRETLPPIVAAAFAILPHLLAAQIMTQNTLLAQYYTTLHNYCQEEGFPSPPPPMEEVIAQWNADFKPVQKEVESINTIARGKVVHTSMVLGDDPNNRKSSVTGLNIRNNISSRRASSQGRITGPDSAAGRPEARVMRIPSSSSIPSTASRSDYQDSEPEEEPQQRDTHLSPAYSPPAISHSPGGPTRDYFARDRQPSNISALVSPGSFSVAGKKKPPPPPPKRIQSGSSDIWVTAMYGFAGQEVGDLSFSEGDKIKVIKMTDSTDDWWDGELKGHRGRFPANYCEMAR